MGYMRSGWSSGTRNQQVKIALTQVTVDNTPPQVSLDFPKDGQVMEAKPSLLLTFKATAFDATGLERVEWWFESQLLAVQAQEPFLQPWQAQPGRHTLQVKAFDRSGIWLSARRHFSNFAINLKQSLIQGA